MVVVFQKNIQLKKIEQNLLNLNRLLFLFLCFQLNENFFFSGSSNIKFIDFGDESFIFFKEKVNFTF